MKNILILSVLSMFFMSCFEERIELDLNSGNKKLVVNAWISDMDEVQFINLSYTVNYLGKPSPDYIDDAVVTLSTKLNSYDLTYSDEGNYYLPEDWIPELSEEYNLEIQHQGQTYSASQIMRPCPEIENVKTIKYIFEDIDTVDLYESAFSFQEIPGEGDAYYAIDFNKNLSEEGDSLYNGGYASDEFFDGEYFDDIMVSDSDRLYQVGDTIVIELYSIGKETIDYLFDIESEVFRGGPFDPPPANVRSNISNGALGYFIIAGSQRVEFVVE